MSSDIDRMLLRRAGVDERVRDQGPPAEGERRTRTAAQTIERGAKRLAGLWAAAAVIGSGLVAVGVVNNPLETKAQANEAHALIDKRLDDHEQRLNRVDQSLSEILTAGKETQELQLLDRVQQLTDRIAKLPPNSELYDEMRQQKNEAEQRLAKVRRELKR